MSSGSRNDRLERLLAALYELRHCEDDEKHSHLRAFDRLVNECLEGHPTVSRSDLMEALNAHYLEYARNRRGYEIPRARNVR